MKRTRKVYWLLNEVTSVHKEKALALVPHDFEVQFFDSFVRFKAQLQQSRAGIILVHDDRSELDMLHILDQILNMPELHGARLILTIQNHDQHILNATAASCFRDMIPLSISNEQWTQRVLYSCAGQPLPYVQPTAQVTLNNISTINLPARLIWISEERIRIECRFRPPVGSQIKLTGRIVDSIDTHHMTLRVEENHGSRLQYRFSDAIVASWDVASDSKKHIQELIWKLRREQQHPEVRTFVAIKTQEIRSALLHELNRPGFVISSALQPQSIESEPKFFTPDIIFIEDVLTIEGNENRFFNMLENIPDHVAVVVIGADARIVNLKQKFSRKKILILKKIPSNFENAVLDKLLPSLVRDNAVHDVGAAMIPFNHQLSMVEVSIPARLVQLHPHACKVNVPFKLGVFGLVKLSSPLITKVLNKDLWIKLTEVNKVESAQFPFIVEAFIVDADKNQQKMIGASLSHLVVTHYEKLANEQIEHKKEQARVPELGTLKNVIEPNKIELEPEKKEIVRQEEDEIKVYGKENLIEISSKAKSLATQVKSELSSKNFRTTALFVVLFGFLMSILFSLVYLLDGNTKSLSGKQFTDSLFKFAPHLKNSEKKE